MTTPSPPPTCEFQSDPMAVTQVSQPLGMVDTHCSPEQAKTNKRTKHKTRTKYKTRTQKTRTQKTRTKKQEHETRTDQQEQINKNKSTKTKQQHKTTTQNNNTKQQYITRTNKHLSEDTKPHPSYPLSHKHEPCTYGSDPTLE